MHNQWISCCCCVICFTGLPVPLFSILCFYLSCSLFVDVVSWCVLPLRLKVFGGHPSLFPTFCFTTGMSELLLPAPFHFPLLSFFFNQSSFHHSIQQFQTAQTTSTTSAHLHGSNSSSSRRQFVTMGAHFWLPLLLFFYWHPQKIEAGEEEGVPSAPPPPPLQHSSVFCQVVEFFPLSLSFSLSIGYMLLEKEEKFFIFRIFSSVFSVSDQYCCLAGDFDNLKSCFFAGFFSFAAVFSVWMFLNVLSSFFLSGKASDQSSALQVFIPSYCLIFPH